MIAIEPKIRPGAQDLQIRCPKIARESLMNRDGYGELEAKLRALRQLCPEPSSTFGTELRAAAKILEIKPDSISRKTFFRIAQEPIIFSYWGSVPCDTTRMVRLASALKGERAKIRDNEVISYRALGIRHVVYPPPISDFWLADLIEPFSSYSAIPLAAYVFGKTIITHPLADGNGRLSRALVQLCLGQSGLLQAPVVPLGPVFELRQGALRLAIYELSGTGDWRKFVSQFADLLMEAAGLGSLLFSRERKNA
jgi:hypothetical protein